MRANYIIYHPPRQPVKVAATILSASKVQKNWQGIIYTDSVNYGHSNEDPYVFNDPWLYSYCKTPLLRRNPRIDDNYIQNGSTLIFTDGEEAENDRLVIDTVFVVGNVCKWRKKKELIPEKYILHQNNDQSSLWNNHFKFGVKNLENPKIMQHPGMFTYEAEMYDVQLPYSFLPYHENQLVNIAFSELDSSFSKILRSKVWGKYPILVSETQILDLLGMIDQKATMKVIGDITLQQNRNIVSTCKCC